MRRILLPTIALLVACSSSGTDETAGTTRAAIINGTNDTTHEAVVAIISQSAGEAGECTGTIVKVDATKHIGWVATAAHCVKLPPVIVLKGPDYASSSALRFEVIDFQADPNYTGDTSSPNDFAMVRIAGVDSTTPTIPLATSVSGLTGKTVTSVGYGRTTLNSSGSMEQNSIRHAVTKTVAQADSQYIQYDQATSGICQGDSGGPVLYNNAIVGIHSFVEGDCNNTAYSDVVTSDSAFWNGQLAKAAPAEDCDLCTKISNSGTQECAQYLAACLSDPDCKGYYDCLSKGMSKATCLAQYPKAEGPFNAAANCTCTRACTDLCATTLQCKATPKCGYKLPAGDCTTCTEASCCTETLDCAADGECYLCLKTKDADAETCGANAARKKLATCVATNCKTQCEGSGLDTGADPNAGSDPAPDPGNGGGGTTTTTTSGCSVGTTGRTTNGIASVVLFGLVLSAVARRRHRGR